MLKRLVYDHHRSPEGHPVIGSLARFRALAGKTSAVIFSDAIVKLNPVDWPRFLDLFIFHQASLGPPAETYDYVHRSNLVHFSSENVKIERGPETGAPPEYSFVIPFRDRDDTLPLVIDAASRLCGNFELILVDDGSTRPVGPTVRGRLDRLGHGWTIVSLPPAPFFRAGFARNVGARQARGRVLVFIDSDILLPVDFLQDLEAQLCLGDVIQAKRWQIWKPLRPRIGEVYRGEREEPNPYWNEFQNSPLEWMREEDPWRWASTFCFAVEKRKFDELGGFRLWYDSYGFEDTDFGLRAHRAGMILRKSSSDVFHLSPLLGPPQTFALDGRLRFSARKFLLVNGALESLSWLTHLTL